MVDVEGAEGGRDGRRGLGTGRDGMREGERESPLARGEGWREWGLGRPGGAKGVQRGFSGGSWGVQHGSALPLYGTFCHSGSLVRHQVWFQLLYNGVTS